MKQYPSEEDDLKLAQKLVFNPNGLTVSKIPRGAEKSADLKVLKNDVLVAYCELKPPREELLDKVVKQCQIIVGGRNDPTFNRIGRLAQKAAKQFRAINDIRSLPNILVFVNHDDASGFGDLIETFTGLFHATDGSRHVLQPFESNHSAIGEVVLEVIPVDAGLLRTFTKLVGGVAGSGHVLLHLGGAGAKGVGQLGAGLLAEDGQHDVVALGLGAGGLGCVGQSHEEVHHVDGSLADLVLRVAQVLERLGLVLRPALGFGQYNGHFLDGLGRGLLGDASIL